MTNSKLTKRSLLASSISLLLCFTMLLGTTFAWFTDSASTGLNKIMAGNLNVELYMHNGTDYVNISENKDPIFGSYNSSVAQNVNIDTLWEPGKTQVAYLKIKNEGNLALKYQVALNTINPADGKDLYKVMQYQIVPDAQSPAATWTAGTGINVTPGTAIVSDVDVPMQPNDEHYFALLVHMDENAGNEYMDGKVEFDISVIATQLNAESDSFGTDYDKDAAIGTPVSNIAELTDALASGGNIVLASDISDVDANTAITVASGKDVTLDLNGHKISSTADKSGNQELFLVKGNMTVKNGSLEFTAQNNQGWGSMATIFDVTAGGVLNLEGVTANISGTDMNFIVHLNNWGAATLNVNNCDFTATYVAVRAFNSGHDMNNVTIKNTDFHNGRMFWVHNYTSEGADDSTLNLDIYGNNNTSDNTKPVRFGFDNEVYYDINGNVIN